MASPTHNDNENLKIEESKKWLKNKYGKEKMLDMMERFREEANRMTGDDIPDMDYIRAVAYQGKNSGYPIEKVHVARACLNWETMDQKKNRRRSVRG